MTLGIETSCDETAAAVLRGGRRLLSNVIATQIPVHQKFGGVVPEIASRHHIVNIMPVIDEALRQAEALAFARDIPLIGVNHLEGHIFANFLSTPDLTPPFVALVVSGGHTALVEVRDYNHFALLGETRDDAAGEAFDKVARVMGLPYPGGPEIDRLAREGDPMAIDFPQALKDSGDYAFSFSGLKSAVLNYLNEKKMKGIEVNQADVAASFQQAVVEVLTAKAAQALRETGLSQLVLAGGVAANSALEGYLRRMTAAEGAKFYYPSPILCTDNAAMIACRGYYQALAGEFSDLHLNAVPGLGLHDRGA